ncbi:hypothetical protein ACJX0J_042447, partial [Zea mays]
PLNFQIDPWDLFLGIKFILQRRKNTQLYLFLTKCASLYVYVYMENMTQDEGRVFSIIYILIIRFGVVESIIIHFCVQGTFSGQKKERKEGSGIRRKKRRK